MGFTKPVKPASNFKPAPAGTHPAVLTWLYDCGERQEEFQGKSRRKHQLIAIFELPTLPPVSLPATDDRPARVLPQTINKWWNFSWNEKANFRLDVEAWRGKPLSDEECEKFDVSKMAGAGVTLYVMHEKTQKGEERAVIRNLMPLAKPQWPKPSQAPVVWSVDQLDSADELEQLDIPGYVKEEIKKSDQYKALLNRGSTSQPDAKPDTQDAPFDQAFPDDSDSSTPF